MTMEDQPPPFRFPKFLQSWKPWGIVLVPSLVGGLFAIGPTAYQEYTKPRAVLSYTRVSGPAINTANGFRQISLIKIENTGKVPLTAVTLEVQSADGQIESSALQQAPGLKPVVQTSATQYSAVMERMLPTETLSASIMTLSSTAQPALKLGIRSNEVLGSEAEHPSEPEATVILSILLAMFGMIATSFLFLFTSRLRRRPLVDSPDDFHAEAIKADFISFLCIASEAVQVSDDLLYRKHKLTYQRAGDLFLFSGLNGDAANKTKCAIALRLLLSCVEMTDRSADCIRFNLALLGENLSDEDFKMLKDKGAAAAKSTTAARKLVMESFPPQKKSA